MLKTSLKNEITTAAAGWLRVGVVPCEAEIRNWGVPGCARWVVVLTHADRRYDAATGRGSYGDKFLEECDTRRDAERLCRKIEQFLDVWVEENKRRPAA